VHKVARRPIRHKFVGKLAVETEVGAFLGEVRIRLLEAIDRHGSISQAAKVVPLSYKAAWDAVDAMNKVTAQPLVERSTGGRHGGGTTLTPYGRRMISMYRAVEQEYQGALDRLADRVGEAGAGDMRQFQGMLRRMALRTSARNQLVGPITALSEGARGVEARIRVDDRNEISSLITQKSAESLDLRIGAEVHVFFKAASVSLRTDAAARRLSRNALWGSVARIDDGPAHAEVDVALESGRHVKAILARDSLSKLELHVGKPCCAVVDAASVVLFRFD
jgi:molybdate transport system regulatory protein